MIRNPIRFFAVLCVTVISGFIMWMAEWIIGVLSGPGWCRTALGAEKVSGSDGTIKGLDACVGLLTIQLRSLATNSYIMLGVIAMCLLVLIVVVIAGARLDFKASASGIEANVASDATDAAKKVAEDGKDALDQSVNEVKEAAK